MPENVSVNISWSRQMFSAPILGICILTCCLVSLVKIVPFNYEMIP